MKLEHQLSSIIAKLELEGKRLKVQSEEREKYWAEKASQDKINQETEKAKEKQLNDFKLLIQNSKKYKDVIIMREYITAVEERAKGSGTLTIDLQIWIQWAKNKTNWYDPLLNQIDTDFDEVDRDTLIFKRKSQ